MSWGFLIKKFISALLMPLSIGLILIALGLWYLSKGKKRAKVLLWASVVWIVTVASMPFAYFLIAPLENSYHPLKNIPKDVKYILLLGGDKECRSWEVVRLYQQIPNVKVITSGDPSVSSGSGAVATAKFLEQVGVDKGDIIMQTEPKDTEEEVVAIKKRLQDTPFIVVTSAYQMPRAMLIFKKYGLKPISAPTDFKTMEKSYTLFHFPKGRYLSITEVAWHEYLGILWFKLKGYFIESKF
jgi:uncharacterized SAM-binding protein YcdF (DUF218 family)